MPNTCIYCQEEKPDDSFRRAEHVVPQSFGRFRNNFTLNTTARNKTVCDICNQFFGDHLEIALARDTYEGQSRFAYGVRDAEDFRPFGRNSRIVIKLAEGEFEGAYAYREYSPDAGDILLQPLPQVGFRSADSTGYEYYLLDEIPERLVLEGRGIDFSHPQAIRAFAVEEALLRDKLEEKNIGFQRGGAIVPPNECRELLCAVEGNMDQTIFRTICKIACNYLAFWQGRDFVNEPSFDIVRQYIRYAEQPDFQLVRVTEQPILGDEPLVGQRRLGHLVTVNWAQDAVSIVSRISLFNWVTYCVSLARDYPGERRDIRRGHFFNVTSGEILELEVR